MKQTFILKGGSLVAALLLLAGPLAGAAMAGEWAVAGDGCKVFNPHAEAAAMIRWTGACKDGFIEGMGTLEWQTGGKTSGRDEGQWRGGRQVSGSQSWAGARYDGEFADGFPAGHGVLAIGDSRYEGTFAGGKPNGKGVMTSPSGTFEGGWTDGCFNGKDRRAAIGVALQSCP